MIFLEEAEPDLEGGCPLFLLMAVTWNNMLRGVSLCAGRELCRRSAPPQADNHARGLLSLSLWKL